jgi:hypothetical protein
MNYDLKLLVWKSVYHTKEMRVQNENAGEHNTAKNNSLRRTERNKKPDNIA